MAMALFAIACASYLAGGPAPLASRSVLLSRARMCAPAEAPAAATEIQPPKMESAVSFDFVPLQTALASGEFREADCITRAALITIAGEAAVKRGYVYFTEVPKLPVEDMATIERLWQAYSDGKFGYSVQRQAFISKKVNENFENFFERIGWKNKAGSLLRWLPEAKNDEFIYDAEKAPKGHLPLTSALRGTQLLNGLLTHPAWETEGKRSRLRLAQFLLHTHLISCLFFLTRVSPSLTCAWQNLRRSNSERQVVRCEVQLEEC